MNADESVQPPRRRLWRWVLGVSLGLMAVTAIGAYDLLTLNRAAAVLRREVIGSDGHRFVTRVQLSLNGACLSTIRAGLHLTNLPAEARLALQSVRKMSVGVYELRDANDHSLRPTLAHRADEAMVSRGYTRIVGVKDKGETVLIYAPADATGDELDVCLAVMDGENLVIASVRIATTPLVHLIERELRERSGGHEI